MKAAALARTYLIPRRNPPHLPPRIRIPYARQIALLEAQVGHRRELVPARARLDAGSVEQLVFCFVVFFVVLFLAVAVDGG
jgi:hypothetical protein